MATLTVTESTDFRGAPAEINITDILFDTTALATAEFTPSQFGAGLISNNVEITGDDQANIIQIEYAAQGEFFSAAGWQFQNWNPETDVVFIIGIAGGDDTITGSSQNDIIAGGGGIDVIDAGGGNDTIWASSVFAAGTTLDGGAESAGGLDEIVLFGVGATDLRPADISDVEQLSFGFGGQTATVDGDQVGGGGFTTIQGDGTNSLTVVDSTVDLSGVTFLSWGADDTITIDGTNIMSNALIGSSQADTISGSGASVDYITGGDGADTLIGGGGFDTFRYHSGGEVEAGEVISGGSDYDTIRLENAGSIDFGSATISNVENLTFAVGCVATLGADQIGGGEIGTVSGSVGFDALVVNAVDQAASLAGVSFNAAWDATDTITINGSGLDDALSGSVENDTINGMGGTDLMGGGAGNDTYIVDDSNDVIAEVLGGGTDLVRSSVSFVLDFANVENLILTGGANTNATGNSLANVIVGNSGNNVINGDTDADFMFGGDGNDTYVVDDGGDMASESGGGGFADTVESSVSFTLGVGLENLTLTPGGVDATGNGAANTLTGNSGANRLDGAGGADAMNGGGGNDTYVVNNGGDTASESGGGGFADTVESSVSFTLGVGLENLTLTGTANTSGTGNGAANVLLGNSGNNRLDGAGGADTMNGGLGNDTYVVNNGGDTVSEAGGGGSADTVESSVSFTLGAGLEHLTLTGVANIDGTGNAVGNILRGNSGANRLDGNGGNDTFVGNGGADVFVFDDGDGADTVNDFQNGSDTFDLTAVAGIDAFSDLVLTDTGSGVDVDYGTGSFELANVANFNDVDASDFVFV